MKNLVKNCVKNLGLISLMICGESEIDFSTKFSTRFFTRCACGQFRGSVLRWGGGGGREGTHERGGRWALGGWKGGGVGSKLGRKVAGQREGRASQI